MKAIYRFNASVGSMGDLSGIFVADIKEVKYLINSEREVYFGECLGKHSEITFPVTRDQLTLITDDQEFISKFEHFNIESGINPIHIYKESLSEGCYSDF